jgi:DnaJ-like protein
MKTKWGHLFFLVPVMLLLDSASTKAQEPLEIVSAQYGTDASSIDVTAQVRSLVRRNTLYVTVDPRALGVRDPMPGVAKVLRVQYRVGGNGYQASAADAEILSLPGSGERLRRGGRSTGRRSDGLRIVAATYGARDRFNDVRPFLQSRVQDSRLELEVSNQSMGGDPILGEPKALHVTYEWEGRSYDVVVPEGQSLSIPNVQERGEPDRQREASLEGLTGSWQDNAGGHYLIRQVGDRVFWVDDGRPKYLNVFAGNVRGRIVDGEWADLPGGQLDHSGTLQLRIESNDRFVRINSGGVPFGGSVFTRTEQGR